MSGPGQQVAAFSLSPSDQRLLLAASRRLVELDIVSRTEDFVLEAQLQAGRLSEQLRRRLLGFRRFGHPSGGMLIRGVSVDPLPPTPESPEAMLGARGAGGAALSVLVACLGEQYGFHPELGGSVVQDILPVRGFEDQQISVSSEVALDAHTETGFSPHRPDYVALLCLRPDHEGRAGTTLSSIDAMLSLLDPTTVGILREPRFRTPVDSSFVIGDELGENVYIDPIRVIEGSERRPRLRADFAGTVGKDRAAKRAFEALRDAAIRSQTVVRLETGELLIVDNHRAVHGRTPFVARYDGSDRWLLRSFIARDLARSESARPADRRVVQPDYTPGEGVPA
jgi:L-asparagine oxygenase